MLINKDLIKRLKEENYEIKEECQATLSYNVDLESIKDTSLEILNEGCYETNKREILPQISEITYTIYKDGEILKNFESMPIDGVKRFLENFNRESIKNEYEKFKLQWMIDHDKTIEDIVDITNEIITTINDIEKEDTKDILGTFETKIGFDGEIYPSFEEWCNNEKKEESPEEIEIPLNDEISLIVSKGVDIFDKELNVFLKSYNGYQDIATISPHYTLYPSTNTVHYDNDVINVKLYADEDDEDYTQDIYINVSEDLKDE